jgi:hypothetical protein
MEAISRLMARPVRTQQVVSHSSFPLRSASAQGIASAGGMLSIAIAIRAAEFRCSVTEHCLGPRFPA